LLYAYRHVRGQRNTDNIQHNSIREATVTQRIQTETIRNERIQQLRIKLYIRIVNMYTVVQKTGSLLNFQIDSTNNNQY